jgi:CO/xanthine dehydrogenase Mo-binding subunit
LTTIGYPPAKPSGAPAPEGETVGRRMPAVDARARVTGRAQFSMDASVPGMLHGKVLRSTHPHARIVAVDASRAQAVRGVVGVLLGRDLLSTDISSHYGPVFPDRPIVAIDRVRYVGEPVAVVIAEDPETAADAATLIDVEYEPLPAYFDPEAATAPEAVPIHSQIQERDFAPYPDLVLAHDLGTNVLNHFKIRRGNAEAGFRRCDHVFEGVYRTPALQHASLEPHVTICQIVDRQATVWSSASSPFTVRFQVAETLRIPQSHVRVIVWNIGGAFGGKTYPRIEPLVAAASWRVGGRPVRIEFDRAEEFYTITRHAAVVRLSTGVMGNGTFVARKATILWSAGAYADISPRLIKNGGYASIGPYRFDDVWVDSFAVYTNVTPAGGFRGYGVPQVAWAYESQLDEIAVALGLDPVDVRRRNLLRNGDLFSTGQVMDDVHYHELLDATLEALGASSDPSPRRSRARGRGVAATAKGTVTPSTSTATLRLNQDGSLNLLVGTTEIGQGARTSLAQIAADAASVSFERVIPLHPDTELTPWDQTTSSSRSTMSMGGAIQDAATELRRQILELASSILDVSVDHLELVVDGVRTLTTPDRALSFAEVVRLANAGNLLASGTYVTEGHLDGETGLGVATAALFQAVCGADVEVDLETGVIEILHLAASAWAGKVVNPTFAELQTEGNVAFGIGQALFEEIVVNGGQVSNASLAEYLIPSFEDMPQRLDVTLAEAPEGEGRIYGLGESAIPAVAPAIANAVFDACGVRVTTLPVTPEKVLRALRGGED